ncbi:MAG TPA: PAS domain S-box protein, partial [Anaerolineales bacterium]|nr:PAS domain S-box protein [Anaerolineales bacterium]
STIDQLLRIFIEPLHSYDTAIRHKSRLLSIFLVVMIFIFTAVDITYVLTVPGYTVPWYGYIFLLISYVFNRWGYYNIASVLIVFMFPAVIFFSILSGQANNPVVSLSLLVLGLIVASSLLTARGVVLLALINLFGILMLSRLLPQAFPDAGVIIVPLAVLTISAVLLLVSIHHRDQLEFDRRALLRLSEERYRMLFEEAPDGILIVNGLNRIVMANSVIYKMTGYTSEELIGRSPVDFVAPENLSARPPRPFDEIKVPGSMRRERTLIHKNGSRLNTVISSSYMPDGELQYIIQDVSERKRMEEALRLSEERYRLVSSVISDYTFSNVQNETGEIVLTWVAGAFEQISGYTFDEFNARGGWVSTVHPDDLEQDAQDMEKLRNNQRVISELRTIHKDGTIRWVKSYAHPVWDEEQSRLIGIYGAVQDITDRKRIEHEREELIRDLEAKNQELEQFTYTVSHDLKAPIITIKGFLGFLGADALAGDKKRLEADIQRINDAADKMNELLTDLLELSRIGRKMNAPEMILFDSLVNEVIETTNGRLQEGRVDVIVKGPFPNVYGDRQRLLEVVQNLVDNAAKFMGEQPSPQIEIGQDGRAENGYATFFVRDNGIGIASEFHERIFGLFNRLNPKIEGTGIGLALVKRIVEFHGGRIWIQSEAGSGATFYFTLPDAPIELV